MSEKTLEQQAPQSAAERERIDELRSAWHKILQVIFERTSDNLQKSVSTELELEDVTRAKAREHKGEHKFIIVSGPSGGGKGTVGKSLEERGFSRLPRATTRESRPGEIDGVDYIFMTKEEFEQRQAAGEFIQTAETHGEYRGTLRSRFQDMVDRGEKFYTEGSAAAYQEFVDHPTVKQAKFLSLFLLPPSFAVLEARLRNRADTISETEIIERLGKAVEHLKKTQQYHYDAYYVNDDIQRVVDAIEEDF